MPTNARCPRTCARAGAPRQREEPGISTSVPRTRRHNRRSHFAASSRSRGADHRPRARCRRGTTAPPRKRPGTRASASTPPAWRRARRKSDTPDASGESETSEGAAQQPGAPRSPASAARIFPSGRPRRRLAHRVQQLERPPKTTPTATRPCSRRRAPLQLRKRSSTSGRLPGAAGPTVYAASTRSVTSFTRVIVDVHLQNGSPVFT